MASDISDYALIGDGRTAALVSRSGSIDFLCLPRFDSDACCAALLGTEKNGCWRLAPSGQARSLTRRYRGDTMILETEITTEGGSVRVTDLMPWHDGEPIVLRFVEGLAGTVAMATHLSLRFDGGRMPPWLQQVEGGVCADAGPHMVVLHSPVECIVDDADVRAAFEIRAGQSLAFSLCYAPSSAARPSRPDANALLAETERAWSGWIAEFSGGGRWAAPVTRSLLTLKALVDRRTGGLVAAATMGLPEVPGGSKNWDYRYCWLRDSTFTLTALVNAGFHEEATRWRDWILRSIAGAPDRVQIVYRIDGGRGLGETEADWLLGYGGARPVLIGNAASGQTQLDVFGELIDSFHVAERAGIARTERDLAVERKLVEHLEGAWDKRGADIWESRGDPQRYTYSQAMAWVGLNHFLASPGSSSRVDADTIRRLEVLRRTIHATVCEQGFSASRGHFVQHQGSETLDASLLLLPLVGFLPVSDARVAGTIAAVERHLMEGGFVRRKSARGDGNDEGAFLACSCWLADCYAMQGRRTDAETMLDCVIGVSNDVGLLSEEFHVPTGRLIGNFPQALTHLGVVNSALFLSGPVVQRGAA